METNNEKELKQLNTLAVLHYVWGGITLFFGLLPVFVYFILGIGMLSGSMAAGNEEEQFVLGVIGGIFIVVASVAVIFIILFSVLKILTGVFLQRRKHRIFCMVIAGFECLNIPLGTLLGVFTLITLEKPEVKSLFQ